MLPALLRRSAVRPPAARPPAAVVTDRLVRGVTAGLAVAAVAFVLRFGSNLPVIDEWFLVQPLLQNGITAGWLVEHHNEHRYPLAKLLWAGLLTATGYDFRAGMLVSAGLLTAASAGLLAAARRLRGRSHAADLVLPALLLHWGHSYNLLMGYQVAFTLVAACGAGLLSFTATAEPGRERFAGLGAGAFLLLMTQNGGFGLGYAGPLALWVAYLGWRSRSPGLAVPPLLAVAYAAFAWLTTPPSVAVTAHPDLAGFATAFVTYLATGLGSWAFPPRPGFVPGGAVAVTGFALAVGLTVRAVLTRPDERPRAAGLLAFLLGHLAVAAAVAWYRGEAQGERFVSPSAIGLCGCWLALVRYGPRPPAGIGVALGLAAAAGVYGLNVGPGYKEGVTQRSYFKWFLADVRAGLPPLALAGKYGGQWRVFDPHGTFIAGLRAGGLHPFRDLPPDPPLTPVPVPHPPQLPACDNAAFVAGNRPAVRIPDPPGPVLGLRVRVEQRHFMGWQELALAWDGGTANAYPPIGPGRHDLVFWVGGKMPTDVRLVPACPTQGFGLLAVEWLLPAGTR